MCGILYHSCTRQYAYSCEQFLLVRFRFRFLCVFILKHFAFAYASLDHFVLVLVAFVVLGLVSSVPHQEICWEERLQNDQFCVE